MNKFNYLALLVLFLTLAKTPLKVVKAVDTQPAISGTNQPKDQTVYSLETLQLTCPATGGSMIYQWQKSTDGGLNYVNVGTASSSSNYNVTPATIADAGMYRCYCS